MNNPELEKEYIKKCLTNQTRQLGIKDFVLNKGDYVRIINLPNSFEKKRFNISRESYKIEDRLGNIYTLIAADGSTRNVFHGGCYSQLNPTRINDLERLWELIEELLRKC